VSDTSAGSTANEGGRPNGSGNGGSPAFALVDYADPDDARDLVALLDGYARDPTGGGEPLSDHARENLAAALAATPNAFSLIGRVDGEAVALANCFTSLSTFACRPLVNVHDLAVAPGWRGRGIGRALLAAVAAEARSRGACKVTLEVLEGNAAARRVYERAGFAPYALGETFGSALFLEKKLRDGDARPGGA